MDFYQIKQKRTKNGIEIYPDFKVVRSKDLMIRGKSFYAIWDETKGLWSTDEYDVQRLVDQELLEYKDRVEVKTDDSVSVKLMSTFSTNSWNQYRNYIAHLSDNSKQLDENLTFQNTEITKKDYVSKRLPYSLEEGECDAYNEILGTLYDADELAKLEWAIGSIIAGDAREIQKFIVLYGEAGTGKSTFLNILQKLFKGYYTTFDAKALTGSANGFSTEVFRDNPLVAIQHDGDLSKIEDNTKLNSIVSHEELVMNEKYKPSYSARANCFLFMATNKPVKISEAKSGIIRRLIDVRPSGNRIPVVRYFSLMSRIDFELGAIANKCLKIYQKMGKNYYSSYRPLEMMLQTDLFFNFVEENYYLFLEQDGVSLSQAYTIYKTFCDESSVEYKLARHKFRDELKNYFKSFNDVTRIDGKQVRSYYSGFLKEKFRSGLLPPEDTPIASWINLDNTTSLFDDLAKEYSAQYASNKTGAPVRTWSNNKYKLKDLNTKKLHYVQLPENHIVIDFDLKVNGEKSSELNIEAATKWPPTYAEYSKSQAGLHLHYIYQGDPSQLSRIYSEGIEVKVFSGDASLRRKLSKCNNIPVANINSGLPLKGEKVLNFDVIKSEQGIRNLIKRNLLKEIHPATKPSIDFIYTILEEAYQSGMYYDVTDMRQDVFVFATSSTNQSKYCVELVAKMKFKSEEPSLDLGEYNSDELAFFDVEVFPNLLYVCWKYAGKDKKVVHMINPKAEDLEPLFKIKLIGFNCRRYDNHILYARYIGYTIEEIFNLSSKIIGNTGRSTLFGEAYSLSYADIYDFSSKKQSLKKFQLELGITHQELGLPFDKPVSEDLWSKVGEYCENDVISTEAVFEDRKQDFIARQILAELSGLTINDSTQMHTAKIIFGNDKNPQEKFIYTDLSELFPGYKFEMGKSTYRNEEVGEGGYVYAEPGFYQDVYLLDVASMHPTSIELLDLFGPYTRTFSEIKNARIAIKHKNYDMARKMLGGILDKYLVSEENSEELAYALKIIINIVYGLTSARFDNKFKDPRNKDNIVAKRGALFMIDLKYEMQDRGFKVVHIKTDSIKIPSESEEFVDLVVEFGKKYGYDFEHEATYSKLLLVNDAVYIAKDESGHWTAVGAEFAHPYIFKTLFSKEPISFEDLCEIKSVTTALYLDMNEDLPEGEHKYSFVGKSGSFCPMKPGTGGGLLVREAGDKYNAAAGTKGYRWQESEVVKSLGKENDIDLEYYNELVRNAVDHIEEFVKLEVLIN